LGKGEVVYVDDAYNPLRNFYTLMQVNGSCANYNLFKLALKS
jgi:hypothetical protein